MKKIVKSLVIAASAVAVVGLGAVSYAKWAGGTLEKNDITGSTGAVSQLGFNMADEVTLNALLPFDQTVEDPTNTTATVALTSSIYSSVALTVNDDGKTYNVKAKYTVDTSTKDFNGKIYCKAAAAGCNDTITMGNDKGETSLVDKGWVLLEKNASGTVAVDGEATWNTNAPTVYFLLVSTDTSTDMNRTFTVTLELEQVGA